MFGCDKATTSYQETSKQFKIKLTMLLFHLTALCSPCFGAVMMLYKENIILHANLHKLISLILESMTYTHARGDLFHVRAEMCIKKPQHTVCTNRWTMSL